MKEVHAVKDAQDIGLISRFLERHFSSRESDVWQFGINTALRISDLLNIRFTDIQGDMLRLKEQKTGKQRSIKLNDKALAIIAKRQAQHPTDTYLFQAKSRNVKTVKPVTRQYISEAIKSAGDSLGLSLSTHSMRKTRGYHLHKSGVAIELICKMLNHSCPSVTLRYIGIEQQDIDQTYTNLVL